METTFFPTVKVERPSWSKLKERLLFRFWRTKTNLHLKIWYILFDLFGYDTYSTEDPDFFCSAEDALLKEELDRDEERYFTARPRIEPRRTVLIYAKCNERSCNFITTRKFEKYILSLYRQAKSWGMTTFIVDNATPFGLLAHEALLTLREQGEEFSLYIFQSKPFGKCKSFRLIPETDKTESKRRLSLSVFFQKRHRCSVSEMCRAYFYRERNARISSTYSGLFA